MTEVERELIAEAIRGMLMMRGIVWDHIDPITDEVLDIVQEHLDRR